ncbi:thermonuclease family protein [Ruegeria faecimaris]|uniref:thermonuclease family protein n=1 Tax=Ruegeria faecimaris TaxID=686389 RepID=UPI002490590E|nr:thermonuclease family protein [Ruegeria faecimaris]
MEVLLLLILVIVAVLLIARSKRKPDKTTEPAQHENSELKPRLVSSRSQNTSQRSRFDACNLVPKPTATVLEGAAYVVDGDTIKLQRKQVRLFGVDAPEINHPYGKKAKWALVALCKGQKVRAEVTAEDDHGRTVAKCYLEDGRDLSAEMVKLGMAIDWPKFSEGKYRSLEVPDVRKKLWLADARQKGRMKVWEKYEAKQAQRKQNE